MFAVHRKGFGVVCRDPKGVKAGDLVVDFLGEMYAPWAWMAKQDAIRSAQKSRGMRECGPPEFYNMQLERPPGDAEGFSILFVDAMHYNNYAARLSHSCDPNVEARAPSRLCPFAPTTARNTYLYRRAFTRLFYVHVHSPHLVHSLVHSLVHALVDWSVHRSIGPPPPPV